MIYERMVVYEIEAENEEAAEEAWAEDGPELAEGGAVKVYDFGTVYEADPR